MEQGLKAKLTPNTIRKQQGQAYLSSVTEPEPLKTTVSIALTTEP